MKVRMQYLKQKLNKLNLDTHTTVIENVYPELDGGRFPVKRVIDDIFKVWADIVKPGHNEILAMIKFRLKGEKRWNEVAMSYYDNDRWTGSFILDSLGTYEYTIEAWTDNFNTLAKGLQRWVDAGEDISVDLVDALKIIEKAIDNIKGNEKTELISVLDRIKNTKDQKEIIRFLLDQKMASLITRYSERAESVQYKILEVVVDGEKARFSSWYEMFHRSQGKDPEKSATFKDCEARLGEIKEMGFDVIYLPPIHPIGFTNRKGPNNAPRAGPSDPGSPWAIGSHEGGHDAVHPDLGTIEDFRHFVKRANQMDIEIALDLVFQCSPDHPWVKGHPEWFYYRSDGTIRYAENPPKRYQDTYPINFLNENWKELWQELRRIILFWIDKGVKIFRVDNPHTKPVSFWEWLIREIKRDHPDVMFFSEAFTRPKIMRLLAKAGFTQSYTYFTWKNKKRELEEFLSEFVLSEAAEFYRGNYFTNTPDILHEYLQKGGRPAFKIRLVLAAILSSAYGIYNGYELCENQARPGTEEYLNSEKYQYKEWDWNRPGNIKDFIAKVNQIRRENNALHYTRNLRILRADNDDIFFYGKWTEDKSNIILVAINLNPYEARDSMVHVPINKLGINPWEEYEVKDLVTEDVYRWKGESNYVRLDPHKEPAHILLLDKNK